MSTPREHTPAQRRRWRIGAALLVAIAYFVWSRPRREGLPLVTAVDGPAPESAAAVLVYLHGRGDRVGRLDAIAGRLRQAGLPANVSLVFLEGPYVSGIGHSWGDTAAEQASSRARIRARLHELLADAGPSRGRLIVAGFSQGAGVAIDLAVEDPNISALASFSPCYSHLRGELPRRTDLRVLLAHGIRDPTCPLEESRSLAKVLEDAHRPAQYIEFDGEHVVPAEAVRALVALATPPAG